MLSIQAFPNAMPLIKIAPKMQYINCHCAKTVSDRKNFDYMLEFSVKSCVRNIANVLCAKNFVYQRKTY